MKNIGFNSEWTFDGRYTFSKLCDEDTETLKEMVKEVGDTAYKQGRDKAFEEMLGILDDVVRNPEGSTIFQWATTIAAKCFFEKMRMDKEKQDE